MTREDGSSGTADTIWEDAVPMTGAKSKDGRQCNDTLLNFVNTAEKATSSVDPNKGRLFYIGLTIPEKFKRLTTPQISCCSQHNASIKSVKTCAIGIYAPVP